MQVTFLASDTAAEHQPRPYHGMDSSVFWRWNGESEYVQIEKYGDRYYCD
jgi:hypothetical protein